MQNVSKNEQNVHLFMHVNCIFVLKSMCGMGSTPAACNLSKNLDMCIHFSGLLSDLTFKIDI